MYNGERGNIKNGVVIDLINSENNVIAITLKYLYDSPDSFIYRDHL